MWQPLKYFVGSWEGRGTGKWGISKAEKVNKFILNGQYLHSKHRSVYKPQEKIQKAKYSRNGLFIVMIKIEENLYLESLVSKGCFSISSR